MIYTVGQVPVSSKYTRTTFATFLNWEAAQREYELDIETTVSDWWCDKELITVQFGDTKGKNQWVIHYLSLSKEEIAELKKVLENPWKQKLIHHAMFEYVVLRFHDIKIENVYDTMLAEQVINGGITAENGESLYSLQTLLYNYFDIMLDKTYQVSFNHEPLIEGQVVYAADDVKHLSKLRRIQIPQLKLENSENTAALEMEAVLGYGDIMYNGIELNCNDWLANLELADPLIEEAALKLQSALFEEPVLYERALELGYVSEQDQIKINWNSGSQKAQLIGLVVEIELYTKAYLQKFLKTNTFGADTDAVLQLIIDREDDLVNEFFYTNYRESLIRMGLLIPAGQVTLNWNSSDQVLPLLRVVEPKLKGLSKEEVAKTSHWIFPILQDYKGNLKLKTTYGEKFIENNLEPDGKIRTNFNQIIATGRVSSSKPNMQNIPAKESVGNRYRNAFTCPNTWKYVDSDFVGQELVIIAYLSRDPVWTEALRKGQDLHSVCSELVFKDKWKAAGEKDCKYYAVVNKEVAKQKCNCKLHKRMRNTIKPINFGLAYGMSEFKLAGDQKITLKEAKSLIKEYFTAFPSIGTLLNYFGNYGTRLGYIQTIWPFFRKRKYPDWKYMETYTIDAHQSKVDYNPILGSIERASKNHPIQGTGADMTKLSLVLIRWFLNDNSLNEQVKLVMQVHDQNTTIAEETIAQWWSEQMTILMEQAAYMIIPTGLLKSETNITDRWSK